MRKYAILFLVGKDRPGIADELTTFLFRRGANLEDSRMATMGGCFSVMTLFSCWASDLETITADVGELELMGFKTFLHEAEDPSALAVHPGLPLKVEVTAMDHPGIVQKVAHVLHLHAVNIVSLSTDVTGAPLSGTPLFHLSLEADVPPDVPIATVKEDLSDLAVDLNLDLDFSK
jgi:glycine cleavage system transcriptional repressor